MRVLGESSESNMLGTGNGAVGVVAVGVQIVRGTTPVWACIHGLHAKSTPPQRCTTWYSSRLGGPFLPAQLYVPSELTGPIPDTGIIQSTE